MKKMKLGTKIIVGFACLILITLLLGALAVYNMKGVEGDSTKLAKEYIPVVDISSEIRGAANRLMYQMRSYTLTEEEQYYREAQNQLTAMERALTNADDLASRAKDLVGLKSELTSIREALGEYRKLMQECNDILKQEEKSVESMVAQADEYQKLCNNFLDDQNAKFLKSLEERTEKIRLVEELVAIGTTSRVSNFKAQATNNSELMVEAIAELDKVEKITMEIRKLISHPSDVALMDDTVTAAKKYQSDMQGFLTEFRKGVLADEQVLKRLRSDMDQNAGDYTKSTNEFFVGQQNKLQEAMVSRFTKSKLANQVIALGKDSRIETLKMLAYDNTELAKGALKFFEDINAKLEELKQMTSEAENLQHIENIRKAVGNYKSGLMVLISDMERLGDISKSLGQLGQSIIDRCANLAADGLTNTTKIGNDAMDNLSLSSTVMIVGLIVALVLGVFLALFITRSITRPINGVIDGLSTGADQVASASEQVSTASQQLAEGSSEQAAAVEETSSSLEEMSSMTKQNADNANHANSLMSETKHTVDRAGHSMKEMSQAMNEIASSGQEISKIIKTIDEIAFQTNLLALNAAVEAARAGEAGQGFAVVADEVRNLAQRAAEAARNTSDLIEDTINKIDTGNQLVRTSGEAFSEVESNAGKVAELVGEIAAASQEQSQGIEQINRAMSQMDQVTQQNAANAEESASAAEELNAQSESMKDVVNDLIIMVGGELIDTSRRARKAPANRAIAPPKTTHTPPPPKRESKPKSKEISADQLIPMDDDFSDF